MHETARNIQCHLSHLRSDVEEGAVGRDGKSMLGIFYGVSPLLPVLQSEREAWILHGSQHVQERSLNAEVRDVFVCECTRVKLCYGMTKYALKDATEDWKLK